MSTLITAKSLKLLDPRTVEPEHAQEIWQKIEATQSACFDDFALGRPEIFAARWQNPQALVYEYGESGLLMFEDVVPKLSAQIHFFLWDRIPEKEIVQIGREAIATVVTTYKLHRVTAMIPSFILTANRIATWIGFRHEGIVRQTWLHKGKYLDVTLYGLLAHEAEWIPRYRRDVM